MNRGTFCKWKPRFEAAGYAGLHEFESRAAHHLRMKADVIATQVVELRQAHPDWGKKPISHAMAKEHGWVYTVSPNAVRRILKAAGLWLENGLGEKGHPTSQST